MGAFWRHGYAATSLDMLGKATGMNRPSLYAAFGDKRALYLRALENYLERSLAATERVLDVAVPLRQGLSAFYAGALQMYFPPEGPARSCFLVGTALTEAMEDRDVGARARDSIRAMESIMRRRYAHARDTGEIPPTADPDALAQGALALLHSIAVRARTGEPRDALRRVVDAMLPVLCPEPLVPRRPLAG